VQEQLTRPEAIDLVECGDAGRVRFHWLLAQEAEPPLLIDLCFAWVAGIARLGSGGRIRPRRQELRGPERHRRLYESRLGCPARFGTREDALVFARADLERPFLTRNADLFAVVAPQLEAELSAALASRTIRERVKGILKRQLAGRRPAVEEVAPLRLSARTLQRRLAAEDASFQQLVQEARRELARHCLLHSSLELKETAYLLGYEDAPSFSRAFHQWEGSPPGACRAPRRRGPGRMRGKRGAILARSGRGEPRLRSSSQKPLGSTIASGTRFPSSRNS
jgi:AraC-like DNA-binding protein